MKNLKLKMLLFSFCALITTQTTFAQENSRAASEKEELARAHHNERNDLSNQMEQELAVLLQKLEDASPSQREAVKEEIKALKKAYNIKVKGQEDGPVDPAEVEREKILKEKELANAVSNKKHDLSDKDQFLTDARKRVKSAKIKLEEDTKNGTITNEEISLRRDKIMLVEKKIKQHEISISEAKAKIAERLQVIKELQE